MNYESYPIITSIVLLLGAAIQPLSAQDANNEMDHPSFEELAEEVYGLDQDLVNGFDYYNRYAGCKGAPFFMEGEFKRGTLTIHGQEYRDVKLRYDITSQLLEMEYMNANGGNSWMTLVPDHIGAFQYGEYLFLKIPVGGQPGKFYQLIRTSLFTCYVHWEKRMTALQNDRVFSSEFTEASPACFLEINGKLTGFKNRNDLAELFPAVHQKEIKRLLKRSRFLVKRASPPEMVMILNQVADLINRGGLP